MSNLSSSKLADQSVSVILSRGLIDVSLTRSGVTSQITDTPFRIGKLKQWIDLNVNGEEFRRDIKQELDYMLTVWREEMVAAANWIDEQTSRQPEPDRAYVALGTAFAACVAFVIGMFTHSLFSSL